MNRAAFVWIWRHRLQAIRNAFRSPHFWSLLVGVLLALALWFLLLYLAVKYADTSLALHSTFCSNDAERNRHILAIILMAPVFMMGLIGVIGEWMTILDNHRNRRKNRFLAFAVFNAMMLLAATGILIALNC